ncbi:MAG: dTDP-4-dehydrorhamnose 3,5-epimerase [Deferribacterales bacterium]|nr:dTDP-4-dehydrorhamnose 3,5-epimerase [Deferribacterales bacterium]
MNIIKTDIDGLLIIEPKIFNDSRGYFFESYTKSRYSSLGIGADFVQDNESSSSYGVVRGLHYQLPPYSQSKLVRVIYGNVLDVAVDLRRQSPTFGRYFSVELSHENKRQLFIPKGFAHGFAVLSERAVFAYKCDNYYAPEYERGILFNDPSLSIDWKIPAEKMIISDKDRKYPNFENAELFK